MLSPQEQIRQKILKFRAKNLVEKRKKIINPQSLKIHSQFSQWSQFRKRDKNHDSSLPKKSKKYTKKRGQEDEVKGWTSFTLEGS